MPIRQGPKTHRERSSYDHPQTTNGNWNRDADPPGLRPRGRVGSHSASMGLSGRDRHLTNGPRRRELGVFGHPPEV